MYNRDSFGYTAEGKSNNIKITIWSNSLASAIKSCKYIMRQLPDINTTCVKDRKGNVLKVFKSKRGGYDD